MELMLVAAGKGMLLDVSSLGVVECLSVFCILTSTVAARGVVSVVYNNFLF